MNRSSPPIILKSSIFVLSALASSISFANETTGKQSNDEDTITLESVVVTGSRRAVKSSLGAPAPVDILSEAQLKNTGTTDLSKALTILAPSFTFPLHQMNTAHNDKILSHDHHHLLK